MKTMQYLKSLKLNAKTLLCSIALLFSLSSSSQAQNNVPTFTLLGLVKGDNGTRLDYATISLLNANDTSVVSVVFTGEEGAYEFKNIKKGNYILKASTIGYQEGQSEVIAVTVESGNSYTVNDLILKPTATSLDEVVITVQKPLIERRADMLVVNVENSTLAAGNNALDILERSPGVSVDKDDNISLQGKQGTLILIDGKETHLSSSQLANLLRSTDGNTIESLEIISNPSAKYDAKGTAGIINIKLKKNKQTGTNGSLSLSAGYGNSHKTSNSLSLNHKNGKISVYGTYNYLNNKGNQDFGIYRVVGQERAFTSFDQLTRLDDQRNSNSGRLGIDYETSDKNIIGVQINTNLNNRKTDNSNTTLIGSSNSALDSVLKGSTLSQNNTSSYSIRLNNAYTIDTLGRKLTADLEFSRFNDKNTSNYGNYFYDADGTGLQSPIILRSDMPSSINIQTVKADYTHPLNKLSKFEAGLKFAVVSSDNDMHYEKLDNEVWENMIDRSNHFMYDEQVVAAYLNYSTVFKKFSFQTGLRVEHTNSDGNSITLNNRLKRDYTDLFPNISINYTASDKHQISLSYSKRINRPYYGNLNPFTYFLDEYTSERGNPYLQPEYTQAFEMNYTLLQRFNFSTGLNLTRDAIVESMEQDDFKKTTTVFRDNFANSKTWFFNVNAPFKVAKFWNSNTNFTAFYLGFKSNDVNNPLESGQFATQVYNNNTFTISPTLRAEATLNYQSPLTYSIYKVDQQWSVDAGLNKSFKNKK
ncbi:MAG TPA: TonB-dependent receptor, partial [Sphingobacteriaceae bacterium]|nr:TonB-dependent receptor [Sphingobacteriaceae bacterium]